MADDGTKRIALVTGARRGIGASIAVALAEAGCTVAVHHLAAADEARSVVDRCTAKGADAWAVEADLSTSIGAERLANAVLDRFGRIDVLVNNAALLSNTTVRDLSLDEIHRAYEINVVAPLLLSRRCINAMAAAGWGRIVNITSVTVRHGGPSGVAYVASKAALVGVTRVLARELGGLGITVNAVSPGAIRTESEVELRSAKNPNANPSELDDRVIGIQAIKRRLGPDDVAGAVAFLASPAAGGITGQVLEVNGGWLMR